MSSAIFTIYFLLYSRSGSALRVAEVEDDRNVACDKDEGCNKMCCKGKASVPNVNSISDQKKCLELIKSKTFITYVKAKECYSYSDCKPVPKTGVTVKTPCGTLAGVTIANEVWTKAPSASKDPHVVNMAGEKFDILATGSFSLLSLTTATGEDFMINGTIARFGAKCGESFITDLEHTGGWIRKAYNTEALKVRAVQDTPQKQALQINFGQKWEPLSHLREIAHISNTGDAVWLDLYSVKVQVSAGKHWRHGWNFLNLDVHGLASLDDNIRVGGLLGYDDHTHVLQADADCAMFAKTTETDMQDQQSCLSYLKAN